MQAGVASANTEMARGQPARKRRLSAAAAAAAAPAQPPIRPHLAHALGLQGVLRERGSEAGEVSGWKTCSRLRP